MKYLVNCICQQDVAEVPQDLGIRIVTGHGFAAVVSQVEESTRGPSISSLLAFEKVVEAVAVRQTVVPMRYGCLMESEEQVVQLLGDHRQEYEALLVRLCGMTEMGIRLLWPASVPHLPDHPKSPGAAYLTSLRNRYQQDALAEEEILLADRIVTALARWFVEQRREVSSSDQGRLLSLSFLVQKVHVDEFRETVRKVSTPSGVKLLMSGPWPPYNFVAPAD
ncbi:MAG: GvpL/GvpF family gas vesicle protein [Acidobacteriaceae bacterium]|jgi:hypothetical protein